MQCAQTKSAEPKMNVIRVEISNGILRCVLMVLLNKDENDEKQKKCTTIIALNRCAAKQ